MNYTYFINYSCYTQKMKVLLNGKTMLSSNSTILQYMSEPFYSWCNLLPELLYRELGEKYNLVFTGRQEEAVILKQIMNQYSNCLHMEVHQFELKASIQERMIGLSRLMKEENLIRLPAIKIRAAFIGRKDVLDKWRGMIEQLQIKNQYCNTEFQMVERQEERKLPTGIIRFYLAETSEEAMEYIDGVENVPYSFVLTEGVRDGFCGLKKNCYIYGITGKSFFDQVFQSFILFPLPEAFARYTTELLKRVQEPVLKEKIEFLLSVKPLVHLKAESSVELGSSIPIRIRMEPENSRIPELAFEYQIPGVVRCTQQRIFGEKTGTTVVRVYEKGEAEPLTKFSMEVYKRNRITSIFLSEDSLCVGVGDSFELTCQYNPEDADNVDKLLWYTENNGLALVDKGGRVNTLSAGKCRIYCAAEKVFAYCTLEIKPYLRNITLPFPEEETLHLQVGEHRSIVCETEPKQAYDGELIFGSSDLMVANANGNTIIGVSDGEAEITIENESGRLRRSFHVIVGHGNEPEQKTKKKKKIFGLFG